MSDIRSLIERLDQINESSFVNDEIKRIITNRGLPKDISGVEEDVKYTIKFIRDQLQSRDSDSFLRSIGRAGERQILSPGYIERQYLGTVAEQLKLPGLFTIDGKGFVYTEKEEGGNYKSAMSSGLKNAVILYKAGWVTRDKALELQKDNLNTAFKDEKSIANGLFGDPGPAAGWHKTNPIPSNLDKVANKDANPLGTVDGGQGVLGPKPGSKDNVPVNKNNNDGTRTVSLGRAKPNADGSAPTITVGASEYVSKKLTSADINSLNQFRTDEITKELMNELRKLLNVLNDSKLNFKSDIALKLAESDRLYERELSSSDEEKLRTIIYNLKLLEPKASPVLKARLGNYLETIPQKYLSTLPATAPAEPATAPAAATKTEPGASTTSTSKKITWQDLAKLNPEIKNPNLIYPGQEIKLPNGSSAIVDRGDTLGSLAQRYNQGGYDDFNDETPAPAAPTTAPAPAAPTTAPAAPTQTAPTLKPAEAAAISVKIKTALRNFRNQDSLDRIWMDIKSKENFDAIDAQFRTTGKKGIVDAVNSEWGYNKDKQFIPMLKRLGIATK
jgi:LysM repeat protein